MMQKRLIMMFLIGFVLLQIQSLMKGEANAMENDESVIELLARLTCPYELSQVNPGLADDYEAVGTIDIAPVKTWNIEAGRIELYQGDSGGYLALLVKDEKIYCAQYVNGCCFNASDEYNVIPQKSYYHEAENSGYGMYVKVRSAFYIDGTAVHLVYGSPHAKEPLRCYVDDADSILSLVK